MAEHGFASASGMSATDFWTAFRASVPAACGKFSGLVSIRSPGSDRVEVCLPDPATERVALSADFWLNGHSGVEWDAGENQASRWFRETIAAKATRAAAPVGAKILHDVTPFDGLPDFDLRFPKLSDFSRVSLLPVLNVSDQLAAILNGESRRP